MKEASMKSVRILIVDDHAVVRRGVKALLETRRGWRVVAESATGEEAVQRAKRHKPDVVLLDISLQDSNGFVVTRQILKVSPHSKVLILSMHETEQAVRDALDAGARGFVFKSDLDRDLLNAVEMVAQGIQFLTPKASEMVVERYLKGEAGPGQGDAGLTGRQRQVARLLAEGETNKEVAAALNISVKTVETHRSEIMRRLDLSSFSDLVRYAVREGIVKP
jgi:DNA-binding NarL/FixJ family response regulator